jgi:hypothetical protein
MQPSCPGSRDLNWTGTGLTCEDSGGDYQDVTYIMKNKKKLPSGKQKQLSQNHNDNSYMQLIGP